METTIYFITLGLILGTVLVIFVMKYASAAYQAQARLREDTAYRELAERAASAESQNCAKLTAIDGRLAAIEKVLKAVE